MAKVVWHWKAVYHVDTKEEAEEEIHSIRLINKSRRMTKNAGPQIKFRRSHLGNGKIQITEWSDREA